MTTIRDLPKETVEGWLLGRIAKKVSLTIEQHKQFVIQYDNQMVGGVGGAEFDDFLFEFAEDNHL